jgi:hypothetical protein
MSAPSLHAFAAKLAAIVLQHSRFDSRLSPTAANRLDSALQKRSIAVSVKRDELSDRLTRRGTVFADRSPKRYDRARSDIPWRAQSAPRQQLVEVIRLPLHGFL